MGLADGIAWEREYEIETPKKENTMSLYKVSVDGAEFIHYSYWEFTVIASSEDDATKVICDFVKGKKGYLPDYISEDKLMIEIVGTMSQVEDRYKNTVIAYVYQE